ncbi:MAG: lipoyl(octanoyl) transferase LipB [Nitrospiraceae bacterium]|nr:lipoyl(octanoyl) transferase LipB [Nitrospiraceae bacterium]
MVAGGAAGFSSAAVPNAPSDLVCIIHQPVPYPDAWILQTRLHRERIQGQRGDTVLVLEHPPVYTVGRSAQASHWGGSEDRLRAQGADVQRVNRGGSVTYHGPGQIVVYPILQVTRHATGPRQLVWLLEDIIIRVLGRWHMTGHRQDNKPGIWIMAATLPHKIASIGIRIERGVTMHGFALNVDMDLSPFGHIRPCGSADCPITSMAATLRRPTPVERVKRDVASCVAEVFRQPWRTLEKDAIIDISALDPSADAQRMYARI